VGEIMMQRLDGFVETNNSLVNLGADTTNKASAVEELPVEAY
jgi:hypothetical protein